MTVVSSHPPNGTQRGVRYLVTQTPVRGSEGDVVIDLRQLDDTQTTAAGRTVVIRPGRLGQAEIRYDVGHLYGPGCGPETVIGAMVWAALQSKPITISDTMPDVVRPRHVRELADLVLAVISGRRATRPSEYPVRELAEIITLVRPTPVHDLRTTANAPSPRVRTPHQDDDRSMYSTSTGSEAAYCARTDLM